MPDRTPLPRPVIVMAFAVTAVAVTLASRRLRPSPSPPRTLGELTERLRRSDPPLYAVPLAEHAPEDGVFLCDRPRPREEVQHLPRVPEFARRWRGVVYCERVGAASRIPADFVAGWGEYGLRVGPFVCVGDPALLDRIREAVLRG
jgi:hypothetical protein